MRVAHHRLSRRAFLHRIHTSTSPTPTPTPTRPPISEASTRFWDAWLTATYRVVCRLLDSTDKSLHHAGSEEHAAEEKVRDARGDEVVERTLRVKGGPEVERTNVARANQRPSQDLPSHVRTEASRYRGQHFSIEERSIHATILTWGTNKMRTIYGNTR